MAKANARRALDDLYELREIGRYKTGVHRPTLSPDDMEARAWLADKMRAAGLEPSIDGIANVYGRAPGGGPIALAGSHIESQNEAGWLDGALGVIYALEAARAVAEDPALGGGGAGVDVVAFADEEGHFASFFGSYSFMGELSDARIDAATDRSGRGTLRDLLKAAGLEGRPRLQADPGRYAAFFEAHIEQGGRLEAAGQAVGVVTSIVAIWQYRIVFEGQQNHAGTTTMAQRRDAGAALHRLWRMIEDEFPRLAGPDSVWTVGRATLEPGDPSIIPGRAEMLFQFRDADRAILDAMHARLEEMVREIDEAGPCRAKLEVMGRSEPAMMAEAPQAALVAAAEALAPGRFAIMPSGAGHDAQIVAPHIPAAMMFVPSIGGISHHWTENTSDEDIMLGAEVFVDAVARTLSS
ncbi:MAG: hydantoinase/carbamoylase family amidase [Pseudomonadota bacterium]